MSPIDHELRKVLASRAATIAPAPDPLAGIERRARRIRRRRTAAAIAGAAIAVTAVAVTVPILLPVGPARPAQLATRPPASASPDTPAPTSAAPDTPGPTPAVRDTPSPTSAASATPGPTSSAATSARSTRDPGNLLATWPQRGKTADGPSLGEVRARFAAALGRAGDVGRARYRPLWADSTAGGFRYTVGQAWFAGDTNAYDVSYATGGTNGPNFFLGGVTPKAPPVLAFLLDSLPGTTTDLLVLLPKPMTGQVSYDADGSGRFTAVASGRSDLNSVGLVARSRTATRDRVEVLSGDGNLDSPLYRGPVQPLLCGLHSCG